MPAEEVTSTCYVRSKPLDLPLDMSFMNLSCVEGQLKTGYIEFAQLEYYAGRLTITDPPG